MAFKPVYTYVFIMCLTRDLLEFESPDFLLVVLDLRADGEDVDSQHH